MAGWSVDASGMNFEQGEAAEGLEQHLLLPQRRMEQLLVESLASRHLQTHQISEIVQQDISCSAYHREDVLVGLDQTLHEHRLGIIVLKELLHLRGQILSAFTPNGVDAHCLGQLDEVGIHHARVSVTSIVEQICRYRNQIRHMLRGGTPTVCLPCH